MRSIPSRLEPGLPHVLAELAYVAIGSNLDQPLRQVRAAMQALRQLPGCVSLRGSSLYRSPPWDGSDQPDYINAVAELHWRGSVGELFAELQRLEREAGRQREPDRRNQARSLDLDLLLYADLVSSETRLQLPHPRMLARAFVMRPLAELAGSLEMADGRSAAEHAHALRDAPLQRIDEA
jgi:2-amino-4-hydroxy-6-hydroxymethyldihydropteridine diphosphokinase